MSALQDFLGAGAAFGECRLVLPHFRGRTVLESDTGKPPLSYAGPVFAERDTRAAFHIRALLQDVVDPSNIDVRAADAPDLPLGGPAFLFGSRSNAVTLESLKQQPWPLVEFEFGPEWAIRCAGKTFSIPDPSKADTASYEAATDYGVVARLRTSFDVPRFLIAGLGGRATEGCGYYLLTHWASLAREFKRQEFALVLEFPPPFDCARVKRVAAAAANETFR